MIRARAQCSMRARSGVRRRIPRIGGVVTLALLGLPPHMAGAIAGSNQREPLWVQRYNSAGDRRDYPFSNGVSPDGSRVFVTGESGPLDNEDYATVAYDAVSGGRLWLRRYDASGGPDGAVGLAVGPSGDTVYVTGFASFPGPQSDYVTIAYDSSTGATRWLARYDGHGLDEPSAITVSPDGSIVFVTGAYATVAYEASSGTPLWVESMRSFAYIENIAVSPDGGEVIVSGTTYVGPDWDFETQAFDAASGSSLWVNLGDGGPGFVAAPGLSYAPDGTKVFVTGTAGRTNDQTTTVCIAAEDGTTLWTKRYSGPERIDSGVGVAAGPNGDVFVTGASLSGLREDYATIAYDQQTGTQLWVSRYEDPIGGEDLPGGILASPDGHSVYVTGGAPGVRRATDFLTIAYSAADGSQLWLSRYDGPAHLRDDATSLAVSQDGTRLFVSGRSLGVHTRQDYATVAYAI